jgi:hypothetical protein
MQKRKKTNTHENPQNMNNKKQYSRLGFGKQEIPNHQKERCFNEEKKGSIPNNLYNPS